MHQVLVEKEKNRMSKILVLSDSHYAHTKLEQILKLERDADIVVFLGDGLDGLDDCRYTVSGFRPERVLAVQGNCDRFSMQPVSRQFTAGGHAFFCTHGHAYSVKKSRTDLAKKAISSGCDIALYGHTHQPMLTEEHGVMLFNPGAVVNGSYGVITVPDKEGKVWFENRSI